jgi:hypothetical protein
MNLEKLRRVPDDGHNSAAATKSSLDYHRLADGN